MWKRTDRYLRLVYVIYDVLMMLGLLLAFILSIVCFTSDMVGMGFFFLIGGPILLGFLWIVWHLPLSLYSDVKLIRDKLYDNHSPYAQPFSFRELISPTKTPEQLAEEKRKATVAKLNQMLTDGIITREQYDATVKKYQNMQ